MWFPRPSSIADLAPHGSGALTAGELHQMLRDPTAREWRHKVGVAGATDGSAKATTRLLSARGLIFKVDLARGARSPERIRGWIDGQLALAARLGIWHPDKQYFLLRWGGHWHPASVCPVMETLRTVTDVDARLASYTRMLALGLRIRREHGVGLDANPSNFGTLEPDGELFYLDDEVYEASDPREIGEAAAARLTETDVTEERCLRWGEAIERALREEELDVSERSAVREGIEGYPLVRRFEPRRRALLEGMRASARRAGIRRSRGGLRRLTCILADVHANLPALDAVLACARDAGVDDYLFLGDAVGYGPHPGPCIERLAALEPVICIRGNHDDAIGRGETTLGMNRLAREVAAWSIGRLSGAQRAWLAGLPVEHRTDRWLAVHGAPRDPQRFLAYVYELTFRDNLDSVHGSGASVCFYGHTHVPFVHRRRPDGTKEKLGAREIDLEEPGDVLLVNPGSVGQPRDGDPRAAYALWDHQTGRVHFRRTPYPVESTIRDLRRAGLPEDLTFRLEMGR